MLDETSSIIEENNELAVTSENQISRIGKSELAPISRFLESRDESILNELMTLDQ